MQELCALLSAVGVPRVTRVLEASAIEAHLNGTVAIFVDSAAPERVLQVARFVATAVAASPHHGRGHTGDPARNVRVRARRGQRVPREPGRSRCIARMPRRAGRGWPRADGAVPRRTHGYERSSAGIARADGFARTAPVPRQPPVSRSTAGGHPSGNSAVLREAEDRAADLASEPGERCDDNMAGSTGVRDGRDRLARRGAGETAGRARRAGRLSGTRLDPEQRAFRSGLNRRVTLVRGNVCDGALDRNGSRRIRGAHALPPRGPDHHPDRQPQSAVDVRNQRRRHMAAARGRPPQPRVQASGGGLLGQGVRVQQTCRTPKARRSKAGILTMSASRAPI